MQNERLHQESKAPVFSRNYRIGTSPGGREVVDAAVGGDGGGEVSEAHRGPRTPRPLVFGPALGDAPFEVTSQTREDRWRLILGAIALSLFFG